MHRIRLEKTLTGSILDIGGGGEEVIGRLYGRQVTAIDNNEEELAEAPGNCRKLLMDAADLGFSDETFDHVTFFYSLMYMDGDTQEKALAEAARALRKGGSLNIWDADIIAEYPEPFLASLLINAGSSEIKVTYGVIMQGARQDAARFEAICSRLGLNRVSARAAGGHFHLWCQKPDKWEPLG